MFYAYPQTNSAGRFIQTADLAAFVIIEAISCEDADERAESLGIYFDGVVNGKDCRCCGDRWTRTTRGTDEPRVWGNTPDQTIRQCREMGVENAHYVVHYRDGRKQDSREVANV